VKYSVRGSIRTTDGARIVAAINNYALWRLVTEQIAEEFTFEAWVNAESDKTTLFNELKSFITELSGVIDWHVCTHDEASTLPCVTAEEYRGG
jgi:hypothetical protein